MTTPPVTPEQIAQLDAEVAQAEKTAEVAPAETVVEAPAETVVDFGIPVTPNKLGG